ncbi:uncharacterized protein LOC134250724 isoform X1 [Saccostrea cucullata]|uniref:uncharacterized protein LOC134250724 isoform X1 n=1 Tax=Saccostrea cuccullata TaxID=36930 RepID=UPI002ED4EE15
MSQPKKRRRLNEEEEKDKIKNPMKEVLAEALPAITETVVATVKETLRVTANKDTSSQSNQSNTGSNLEGISMSSTSYATLPVTSAATSSVASSATSPAPSQETLQSSTTEDTRIPETCSNNESEPSICARRDVQALNSVSTYLIENALTVGTRASYRRAREVYTTFQQKYFPDSQLFPISANQLFLFISHCFQKSLAPQTVLGYLSALTHFSKMEGNEDPTQHFKVKRAIQGFQKLKAKPDSRLPITPLMLQQIVNSLPNCTQSYYQMHLFKAMFLLAFHAFLRIGEITSSSLGDPLPLSAVSFGKQHDGSPESLCVTMVNFKHHIGKPPVTLQLSANKENKQLCPVLAIWDYIKLRGQNAGPLFMFQDKSPISRQYFNQQLKISLTFLNYDTKSYKGHSFRIGATTWAKSKGVSDDQIQLLGRGKSNAYRKYIRIPLLNL